MLDAEFWKELLDLILKLAGGIALAWNIFAFFKKSRNDKQIAHNKFFYETFYNSFIKPQVLDALLNAYTDIETIDVLNKDGCQEKLHKFQMQLSKVHDHLSILMPLDDKKVATIKSFLMQQEDEVAACIGDMIANSNNDKTHLMSLTYKGIPIVQSQIVSLLTSYNTATMISLKDYMSR